MSNESEYGTRWCPTCKRRRQVMDESAEEEAERFAVTPIWAAHLSCGHSVKVGEGKPIRHDMFKPL